uniref:Uncharacterized protein n=1 Tax=Rhipicephalus zambeziensis TaxID=60191 RepID=A0A224YF75_9ACAR
MLCVVWLQRELQECERKRRLCLFCALGAFMALIIHIMLMRPCAGACCVQNKYAVVVAPESFFPLRVLDTVRTFSSCFTLSYVYVVVVVVVV